MSYIKKLIITSAILLVPIISSAATLSLSPSSQSVVVGESFTVTINLDTQGELIDGVDVRYLNYDPTLLRVNGVTGGSLMPSTLANDVDASNGRITFSQVEAGGSQYEGSGVLATVSFTALSAGNANVTFDYADGVTTDSNAASNGSDILSAVVNGSFSLAAPAGGGGGGGGGSSGGGSGGSSGGSSGGGSSPGGGGAPACPPGLSIPPIGSNIGIGSKSEDVASLQKFLVELGYITADNVTGFFGAVTQTALQKFQAAQGIVSFGDPYSTGYGNAGPSTRTRINYLISVTAPKNCNTGLAPIVPAGPSGYIFTRNLSRGSEGPDVVKLQEYLISRSYLEAGNATGYFGFLTEAALKKFQVAEAIVSVGTPATTGYGNLGPSTRARINSILSSGAGIQSAKDLQDQIKALQAQVNELLRKLQDSQ